MFPWIIWLIIAVVLIIIEVLSQMIWTLCLSVGCICAAIASLSGISVAWQIAVMAIGSVMSFPLLMPWFRKIHESKKRSSQETRTGMVALIGRRGTVTDDILPGKTGRVRIDGDCWQARISDNGCARQGSEVVVTDYDSIILTVKSPTPNHNSPH